MIESLGYRKVCARWVPRLLTEDHKGQRKAITSELLQRYRHEGNDFLLCIVTVLPHPSYSPYLAPSDYHLFGFVKDQLRGQRFETREAIRKAVRQCLRMAGTEFYRREIFKLPER
ncbi:hypothetical protein B7P43_G10055 [Cryptotermes secundus]|uniref:Histone-lysine N-methyltransferase SETMAR n=1 Tax=Cryptotermes secundus TaxID=105785 RepID=A0A2J7QS22_9NEOP|nr:hypothetical protein B7P43_G10055 [Cryptotermes secundus]